MRSGDREGSRVLEDCRVAQLKQRKSEGLAAASETGVSLFETHLPPQLLPPIPGCGQMAQPESDPPLCTLQPGGARASSGDTPGGHLLPPGQPAAPSLAALGRGSQGKLPPGSALHSPASGGVPNESQRTCEDGRCGQSKEEQGPWGGRNRDGPNKDGKGQETGRGERNHKE